MQKYLYALLLFLFTIPPIFTQNITTTFRGFVKNATNQRPLLGATVSIFNIQSSSGGVTDASGNFIIKNVPVGRYEVEINYLGYENLTLTEVLLESGKEKVMEIFLQEDFSELAEVVVKSTSPTNDISPLSNHQITIEEVQRFPATFFDPARLAMLYPGVTGTNDQANGLSIRGLPPSLLQWRLEGVEIVNPNHLSNAGTVSDRPSTASGGVNILSAQMLDNSRLYTGALPVEYSNALGGVMDMRLRKGNNQQYEFTAQAGLLGFDLGMEGPLSKDKKASFLFNYRYSFTGLLTSFGIDFDGESIGFEDVAFNLNFPTERAGNFTVFGIGGKSSNFKEILPIEDRVVEKDGNQIDYNSKLGIGGVKHQIGVKNALVETVVAYSGLKDNRQEEQINTFEEIGLQKEKLSINHKWQFVVSDKSNFIVGLQYLKNNFDNILSNSSISFAANTEGRDDNSYGMFLNYKGIWWSKIIFNFGYNAFYKKSVSLINGSTRGKFNLITFNPKFSLQCPINKNASLGFYFGKNDALFPIVLSYFGSNPKFSSTIQQSINYELFYEKKFRIKAELFHQAMNNIPYSDNNFRDNLINEEAVPFLRFYRSNGNHRSIGLELLFQKYFTNKSYSLFSATLYQSKYGNHNIATLDGKYSGDFILNAVWGKEFNKEKTNKLKTFGFNIRGVIRGGFRERKIQTFTTASGITFPTYSREYTETLPPYFRIDLRFYLKKNKPNRTTTLSLDIQNATNHKNIAYHYFDTFARKIKTQYQLGLIPLINYRIEF